ncbi:MAG TPA: MBL fold metallo-hydrolase [Bacteroidales bacterium]|nr:MBL fold metallo-hydrolase [Bacteroidales bacterium]
MVNQKLLCFFVAPIETARITPELFVVKALTVNFFIFRSGTATICFDTGFHLKTIRRELQKIDIDPRSITHVFLTHTDIDHAGGLRLFSNATIYFSADEEQMITHQRARLLGCIFNPRIKTSYQLLKDNETVAAGSLTIKAISTPGHTPGSMSYLLNDSLLFVGDTLRLIDKMVFPIGRIINMDTALQIASIRKLARLENVKMAFTAHSGYTTDFEASIAGW